MKEVYKATLLEKEINLISKENHKPPIEYIQTLNNKVTAFHKWIILFDNLLTKIKIKGQALSRIQPHLITTIIKLTLQLNNKI